MPWHPYAPYSNDGQRLPSIHDLLNPAPALRDENLTELPSSNGKPLATEAARESQVSNAGDTTQSEISDVSTNGSTTRHDRSSTKSLPIRGRKRPMQVATFTEVAAHTAKCDECNHRNTDGMSRCNLCGWQCCRKCLGNRGQNRSHVSSTGYHTAQEPESPPAAEDPEISSSPSTVPSPASSTVRRHLSPETPNTLTSRDGSPGETMGRSRQDRDQQARRKAAETLINLSNSSPLQDNNSGSSHRGFGFGRTGGEFGSRRNYEKRSRDPEDIADDPLDMQRQKRPRTHESLTDISMAFGEEFDNPRRNPSRRARPIDMKE
ncbi:hypothetical protein N7478_003129 [Penicillium angulare]|uniref:uncharacterized protein n=1 Tax=Penicillium angulare TaxID=116970 RepID=UPI00253FF31E|nr:uncharacterized protein N7478_003129 [Penicillium angulare]KAJ5287443.1 hypothetical protein N7478_003129 [Penicillium angulare]